ncbi:CDP-alcohol phosphatidyltransferase family protein [Qipengyuania oceanensis]|uniref:CDP-diacylglycerol O-phosphatidyltransferase n=1 Tax=Qipengyuania oceanensis TaxID=1463597 RepID=A0A844YEU2_9SPHN|nr:CDP-alcohol phosphatidyltransferase family protein [Qipengyuania oceanensis]MXO63646.1 CDP-diacylglycerol O-phosphatidyltransferase [Qipengyuania oceanensis]
MMGSDDDDPRYDDGGRIGPKAAEDEEIKTGGGRGLSIKAVIPNAVTAAALCAGLTGIRFAITADWDKAIIAVILAGVLDGMDGRIARLLNAQSRFGAEMDSLADSLSFGMAPALILYLWTLQDWSRFGWFAALAFAICCALRLARFNARIDVDEQPHKSAGFLTGVPAPVGAGLAFLPFYLWMATGESAFREPIAVAAWIAVIAFLMISNMATLSWTSLRPRRNVRLELIAIVGMFFGGLLIEPWWSLAGICVLYLALMPYGLWRYSKVKRRRAAGAA